MVNNALFTHWKEKKPLIICGFFPFQNTFFQFLSRYFSLDWKNPLSEIFTKKTAYANEYLRSESS